MNLNEYEQTLGYVPRRICVFGPPKSGKTELVGALAASGYTLHWFDCEDGVKTLLRKDSKARGHLDQIKLFRMPDSQTYPIAFTTILNVVKGLPQHICFEHGAHNCFKCAADEKKGEKRQWADIDVRKFGPKDILVIDSVSQLISSIMMFITREQIAKGNDDYKPDWDDWRKQGFLGDRVFGLIQTGNFNCIGISHEEVQKLENGTSRMVPVGGTGNYSKTFAKYWDDIVYVDVVNGAHKAYSAAEPGVSAIVGSRSGKKIDAAKGLIELFKE
jgi:hypothetical protein